jgi:hypothetical protein
MNGERFERHRALVEDIAYSGMSAQEIAEKYGLSLEGIQQFSSTWAKDEVGTERKVPRMAWRSMIPNQTSTRFSHDPQVGVKWTWILGLAASQVRISTRLWAA